MKINVQSFSIIEPATNISLVRGTGKERGVFKMPQVIPICGFVHCRASSFPGPTAL